MLITLLFCVAWIAVKYHLCFRIGSQMHAGLGSCAAVTYELQTKVLCQVGSWNRSLSFFQYGTLLTYSVGWFTF